VVHAQPTDEAQARRAAMALVACPTHSIGGAAPSVVAAAARAFPEPIAGDVHFCGFASADSFGASSYFVRRAQGNVLVDSPRAARPLVERLAALGGVDLMFLSHRDDVADHARFHRRFGCRRILHRDDRSHDTADIEQFLDGREPVRLADDLIAIPVPGHTRGSTALLYADTFLFTGDHLWWSNERSQLVASRGVCWYSWPEQVRSVARLLDFRFEWVLPGHGARHRAESASAMRTELERLVKRLRTE
jgi:glyoxylase-like metal-dependent hydrolase (beta-lactamase superfamily II)